MSDPFGTDFEPPANVQVARFNFRVGYIDTDRATVMHHAAYLRYLEAARVDYLRVLGLDYNRLERERGLGLPVVDVQARYKLPAFFDDEITITTWVSHATRARLRFDATMHRGAELVHQSRITLCCAELKQLRLCSIPDEIRERLAPRS